MFLELDARDVPQREWPKLLDRLVVASVEQRRRGLPPLSCTRVRYQREPKRRELWQSSGRTAELGYGDCEDLAIYLAGDFRFRGIPARVVTYRVRPGLRHAVTAVQLGNRVVLVDPSRARGMRGRG